ncbi:hypothetical protein LTS08_002516 [Lithohypha guttulata]|uniref:uncharacterized protein n=1 Tax=Lithohypha guttulata TaxID=1690604 RepID=UPI002DDE7774|nr:hypothetical protein LTR51_001686 [Lithohypha guttulata]KAK5104625.1 hypothetical protein LTS08_002516 [Lithohypha guttulata]
MEKTVKGATKIKLAAPKTKYVEPILSATRGGETGVADVFQTLQLRLRDSTWTIVFKALIIVHLMIREGAPEITLRYLAESPKRLAISGFAEVQTQGISIRRYYEYLLERVKAYHDTNTDFVRSGTGKMRSLTVDKGLLRQTEVVQAQIQTLLKCDLLGGPDPENEISLTAFRLLTLDLLELFKAMNEGTINVLEHYFEMSKVDAQRALAIYKTFGRQTDLVVNYLSMARQYQAATKLEVPKLKHAPTTLTSSLEEYLNDPDFEINRRQYLAQQEAKRTGKPVPATASTSKPAPKAVELPSASRPQAQSTQQYKGPAPDLIDFFESIEQNQQPMVQQTYDPTQQINAGYAQAQIYQQPQVMPQQTGYNPFMQDYGQNLQQQPQQQLQQQSLQPDFTGAGFGGYGPQPQQDPNYNFTSGVSSIPQGGAADFSQPSTSTGLYLQSPQALSPQSLQPQATGTNPFRQSMMPALSNPVSSSTPAVNRQSTNPFAKRGTGGQLSQDMALAPLDQQQSSQVQQSQPVQQQATLAPLQSQVTGTNPFAKNSLSPPPVGAMSSLPVNVTGSTNPFRQSQFVNQQTGQGWQHANQGTFGGFDVNNVATTSVFPRPGAQQT